MKRHWYQVMILAVVLWGTAAFATAQAGSPPGATPPSAGYGPAPFPSYSFGRPYPYHMDYFRQRYGGSYAPYFGNLYGPPVQQNFFYPPAPYYAPRYPRPYPW